MTTEVTQRIRGRTWQAIRARILYAQPLCVSCEARGIVSAAIEVDHVMPLHKGGSNHDDNLAGLCIECHKVKTAKDMGHRSRVTIGLDGWPVA